MKKIENSVFSHIDRVKKEWGIQNKKMGYHPIRRKLGAWCSVATVRQSFGFPVSTFRQLVDCVAELGVMNPRFNLLYRGQSKDILDENGRTKILPGLYRPKEGMRALPRSVLKTRLLALDEATEKMSIGQKKLGIGKSGLFRHSEYFLAILQHYRIRKTPLLDATQSLRVAASFALESDASSGFIYVFGMPHTQGSISHFIDEDISLVKLQNVCPAIALRPHYQEGFLLGRLSQTRTKEAGDNAAYRLLAKYKLSNHDSGFWDDDFKPIPKNALLPPNDPFEKQLLDLLGEDPVP